MALLSIPLGFASLHYEQGQPISLANDLQLFTFRWQSLFRIGWQWTVKNDYNANLIIVDFKNYREELNSDSFYNPTKYLNSVAGNFVIVFSRCGLDDTAKKVQHRLLSEKKLVLCLTDSDLINMINQKMNGQEPLNSLENMYYTLCKKQ